ncbi:MAG: hypothetical protein RIA63_03115 [Cyclobacteriaceae bacterium]
MDKIIVQLTHHKALKLLRELEELKIIRLFEKDRDSDNPLSDKFEGKLSSATASKLQDQIKESRGEWDRNI